MSEVSDGPIRPFQQNAPLDMHHLTTGQLASLGVAQIAYVRPVVVDGAAAFSIHAADGTPMALTTDLNMALAAVVHHELIPALVH
jgi:hypothetical protein